MTTATPSTIRDFLQGTVDVMQNGPKINGYAAGSYGFILANGREFKPVPLPADIRQGKAQACFQNCMRLASNRSDLIYVEGYACGIIPVLHAWLTDKETVTIAIDPTWTGKGSRPDGWQYFGVPITTRYVIAHLCKTERYNPIVEDWANDWPILRAAQSEWRA